MQNSKLPNAQAKRYRIGRTIVVTRHQGLVDYLLEEGLIDENTPILQHATQKDVASRHVIGALPLHLAAVAYTITEIPLYLSKEDRGKELSAERVRQIAGKPQTYIVQKIGE